MSYTSLLDTGIAQDFGVPMGMRTHKSPRLEGSAFQASIVMLTTSQSCVALWVGILPAESMKFT